MVWSEPFVKSSAQESLFCGKNEKFHEIQYLKLGYFWATCQAISQFHIYDLRLGYKYPPEYEFPHCELLRLYYHPSPAVWRYLNTGSL